MALGFEVEDSVQDFESKKVTRYSTTSMSYPCYVVEVTKEKPLKMYTLNVLKQMFVQSDIKDKDLISGLVTLYFNQNGKVVRFGSIQAGQVKTFLRLFEDNDIIGFLDDNTPLEGHMLYALSV